MAPEVNSHKKASALSDVFSLHVVMWEVRTLTRCISCTRDIPLVNFLRHSVSVSLTFRAPKTLRRQLKPVVLSVNATKIKPG